MRKFALYYGVLRSNGEREVIAFGSRSEIKDFKDQCILDFKDPKLATKYAALVLATDYGLKNCYKPVLPAKKTAEPKQKANSKG